MGATRRAGLRQDRAVTTTTNQATTGRITPFTLTGCHVRLEPLSTGHAEGLAAAAADRATFGLTTVPDGLAGARAYVEGALARQAEGREVPFAVRRLSDGAVVGSTRFLDLDVFTWPTSAPAVSGAGPVPTDETPPDVGEIGSTWYAAGAQRTAVNTECKLLLLTHAFEVWECLRITFKTDARNAASRNAITRIGAQFEGIRRVHVPATDGALRDSAYFSIVRAEWPSIRERLGERLGSAA